MFLRRNRDETIRDDPIHTSNLVHSRVIDMAPSATEEGEAEIMSDAKKKEKKVWSKPPKIDTSAITGIRAITAIQIASGHWLLFYGSKNQVPIDFQGGLAVSTFFMITGFVLYVGYRHKVCDTETFSYWTFIKRRYARALPLHWICLVLYAPFVFLNYAQIRNDYNFWQNKSGEVNLIMGIALTPFLMHSWIFRSVTGTPCAGVYLVSSAFTFAFRGCAENLRVWRRRSKNRLLHRSTSALSLTESNRDYFSVAVAEVARRLLKTSTTALTKLCSSRLNWLVIKSISFDSTTFRLSYRSP